MEKNIIGKRRAEIITAGWRTVRSTDRRASAASLHPIFVRRRLIP